MDGRDVYDVLRGIGAETLQHANTVTTSCTFLEHGALLSREYVEQHGLAQTSQESDAIDKRYNIWDCVFVDHVNIHYRGGRRKGPNMYGPVLFQFNTDLLLSLPDGSDVHVTKMNPVHWTSRQRDEERWFGDAAELSRSLNFGDFDKMIVIRTPGRKIDFPSQPVRIALDNPHRTLMNGTDAYQHAEQRLRNAARLGGVGLSIQTHECRPGCICLERYAQYEQQFFDTRFA